MPYDPEKKLLVSGWKFTSLIYCPTLGISTRKKSQENHVTSTYGLLKVWVGPGMKFAVLECFKDLYDTTMPGIDNNKCWALAVAIFERENVYHTPRQKTKFFEVKFMSPTAKCKIWQFLEKNPFNSWIISISNWVNKRWKKMTRVKICLNI